MNDRFYEVIEAATCAIFLSGWIVTIVSHF